MRLPFFLCLACATAMAGPDGTIYDLLGRPLEGVRVCYEVRTAIDGQVATRAWADTTDSLGTYTFTHVSRARAHDRRDHPGSLLTWRPDGRLLVRIPAGTHRARLKLYRADGRVAAQREWVNPRAMRAFGPTGLSAGVFVAAVDLDGNIATEQVAMVDRRPPVGSGATRGPAPSGMGRASADALLQTLVFTGDAIPRTVTRLRNADTTLTHYLNCLPQCSSPGCSTVLYVKAARAAPGAVPIDEIIVNDGYMYALWTTPPPLSYGYLDSVRVAGLWDAVTCDAEWLMSTFLGMEGTPDEIRAKCSGAEIIDAIDMAKVDRSSPYVKTLNVFVYDQRYLALADAFVRPLSGERFGSGRADRIAQVQAFLESWERPSSETGPGGVLEHPALVLAEQFHEAAVGADLPVYRVNIQKPGGFGKLDWWLAGFAVEDSAGSLADWMFADPQTRTMLTDGLPDSVWAAGSFQVAMATAGRSFGLSREERDLVFYVSGLGDDAVVTSMALPPGAPFELESRERYDPSFHIHDYLDRLVAPVADKVIQ